MKGNILFVFALFLILGVHAQEVLVNSSNITERDNRVTVSFVATVGQLSTNERLTITPVLYSSLGTRSLQPIVVVGRGRSISDKRIGEGVSLRYAKGELIPYTVTFPYEAWMGEVALRVDCQVSSCCKEEPLSTYAVLAPTLIHYDVRPSYSSAQVVREPTVLEEYAASTNFLYPMSAYPLRDETAQTTPSDGALRIYFQQGSSVIDSSFHNNAHVLAQVDKVLSLFASDSTVRLKKILIGGVTSPDGPNSQNIKIAFQRAASLKSYLVDRVKDSDQVFEVLSAYEDWAGLVKLVQGSDMEYKREVLSIIERYDILDSRERHLKALKWGHPYSYMLKHFFPQLRHAGYVQIYYELTPDGDVLALNRALVLLDSQ